jgi:hypothetical protein
MQLLCGGQVAVRRIFIHLSASAGSRFPAAVFFIWGSSE